MFLRYFVVLPLPAAQVTDALLRSPHDWVPGLAMDADRRGERLLAEVGFGREELRLGKLVSIDVGQPVQLGPKMVLPISWRATGPQGLFPVLDGDVEVAPLGAGSTQIALSAQYQPPLGHVGKAVDRAGLHRIAEATVKDFLDGVARTVEALATSAA
jgi:hypothetical protein